MYLWTDPETLRPGKSKKSPLYFCPVLNFAKKFSIPTRIYYSHAAVLGVLRRYFQLQYNLLI